MDAGCLQAKPEMCRTGTMKKQIAASKCKAKRSKKLPVQWEEDAAFHLSPKQGRATALVRPGQEPPLLKSNGTTHFIHAG